MPRSIRQTSQLAPKVGGGKGKKVAALAVMCLGIVGLLALTALITNRREAEVSVIRLKQPITSGTTLTDTLLEEYKMPKSTYDSLGTIVEGSDTNKQSKQIFLLWSQKDEIIGMYASNYIGQGGILTSKDLTKNITVRNPWVTAMKEDEEIFTMKFDANSVNARMLYPGTRLRARLVSAVPVDVSEDIRKDISSAENAANPPLVKDAVVTLQGDKIAGSEANNTVEISEIVIDHIIITDMTNAEGESIYDLYMSLLKLPLNQRVQYLKQTISENDTASDWNKRVTPSTITFILDKDSASRLAEFEQSGGTIKYTILPDVEDNEDQANLMSQFVELSNQIATASAE